MTFPPPALSSPFYKHRRKNTIMSAINMVIDVKPMMIFLLIIYSVFTITEACSSRSTPKPRPVGPTPRPNITFHTYACPPMYASWYCLNGATCFTVKIGEHLLYNCECAEGYMGPRCEFKDLDSSYLLSRKQVLLETASIAFGATLAILLVVIVCASLYIRYNRKQKQKHMLSVTTCVDNSVRRKPFSRRIPATQLPLSKIISSDQYSVPASTFQKSPESKNDGANYFSLPDVDVELCCNLKNNNDQYLNNAAAYSAHAHNYTHYVLLQKVNVNEKNEGVKDADKSININIEDNPPPYQSDENSTATNWCSEMLPLFLRMLKKIEILFTFERSLGHICDQIANTLSAPQPVDKYFRHADIVELCKPVMQAENSTNMVQYGHGYKVLTVVPAAICIPTETKFIVVDPKSSEEYFNY